MRTVSNVTPSPSRTYDRCWWLEKMQEAISRGSRANSSQSSSLCYPEGTLSSLRPQRLMATHQNTRFGTKRVLANRVYQEYIGDKGHLHMNATRWVTLTEFVKHLGRTGVARVDETEKGWFIAWIDNSPQALAKQVRSFRLRTFGSAGLTLILTGSFHKERTLNGVRRAEGTSAHRRADREGQD
jgi:hypothetical protein